jgi:hypothetical protein
MMQPIRCGIVPLGSSLMGYRRTDVKTTPFVALAGTMLLTACQSLDPAGILPGGAPPRTEAYRAHPDQPIAAAPIAIGPVNLARADDPLVRAAVAAVATELGALGYTPVADVGQAELLGSVDMSTGTASELVANAPEGLRGTTTLPPMAPSTGLVVEIRRRSDGSLLWQGRAATFRPAPNGDPATLAGPLAHALFLGFPGQSGRTIRAP